MAYYGAALQNLKAVYAYFTRKQIPPFGFAKWSGRINVNQLALPAVHFIDFFEHTAYIKN